MDTGILNALALLVLAVVVTWRICKNIFPQSKKGGQSGEASASLKNMSADALNALMAKRYERKRLFRLGVLVCSCLAAIVLVSGQSRIVSIVLLSCAGLCQYGAVRQKTGGVLSQLMQQQSVESKVSAQK